MVSGTMPKRGVAPVKIGETAKEGSSADSSWSLMRGLSNFWWFGFHGRPAELVHWMYPPFFFSIISLMLLSPISPDINNAEFNHSMCPNITAAQRPPSAEASGFFVAATKDSAKGIVSFLGSFLAGYLADKFGRKPVLLMGMVGLSIPMLALAMTCDAGVYIPLYVISGVFDVATTVALSAFIADLVPQSERSIAFGRFFFVPTASVLIGAPIGGFIAHKWQETDADKLFSLCAIISVIPVVWTLLLVPESKKTVSTESPGRTRKSGAGFYHLVCNMREYSSAWLLIGLSMCYHFPGEASQSLIFMYWAKAFPECTEECRSLVMTFFSICMGVSSLILLPVMLKLCGRLNSLRIALFCYGMSIAIIAFASEFWWMWVNLAVQLPAFYMQSIISDLVTEMVPKEMIGQALGLVAGMRQLCNLFSAPLYAYLLVTWESFPQSKEYPGLPWGVGLIFVFVAFCLALVLREPQGTVYGTDDEWPAPVGIDKIDAIAKVETVPLLCGGADEDLDFA